MSTNINRRAFVQSGLAGVLSRSERRHSQQSSFQGDLLCNCFVDQRGCCLSRLASVPLPARTGIGFAARTDRASAPQTACRSSGRAKKNIVWKTQLPGPGTSSPVTAGDRIFLTCYTGYAENTEGARQAGKPAAAPSVRGPQERQGAVDEGIQAGAAGARVQGRRLVPRLQRQHARPRTASGCTSSSASRACTVSTWTARRLWHVRVGKDTSGWGSAASPMLYKRYADRQRQRRERRAGRPGQDDRQGSLEGARSINSAWNTPVLVKTRLGRGRAGGQRRESPASGSIRTRARNCGARRGCTAMSAPAWLRTTASFTPSAAAARRWRSRPAAAAMSRKLTSSGAKTKDRMCPSPIYHDGHLYWASDSGGVIYLPGSRDGQDRLSGAAEAGSRA